MKTTIEVTLRITAKHANGVLDENSVKAAINCGMDAIAAEAAEWQSNDDLPMEAVCVEVTQLKENGKRQALSLYGTDAVPWGRA